MIEKIIGQNSAVSMHIDIRLKDGSVADSTRELKKPMSFQMGTETFSDKLESSLLGLKPGDKKKIMLFPNEAFGESHPANIYQIPKSQLAKMADEYEVGTIILFAQPNGKQMPGIVREIGETEVCIDFNHPLAGQVVLFDVEIVEVLS